MLEELLPGDPLGVRALVRRRLQQRNLLLDSERVTLRALARCARYGRTLRARTSLRRFAIEQVDAAIDELSRAEAPPLEGSAYLELGAPLGFEVRSSFAVCVAVNRFPQAERRLFFRVCLEGVPLDVVARAGGRSLSSVAQRVRRVLDAALAAASPGSASPGAESPGSESPGSESPGAESPGAESTGADASGSTKRVTAPAKARRTRRCGA